ncbi:MAG TPA: hypothetical protein VLG12_02340 [Candidatus Saccharimonadales bacterium]|nr:hypothetical protein [Candidatus Saccharimonadales bacterium]
MKKVITAIIVIIIVVVAGFYGKMLYRKSHLSASFGRGAGGGQSDRIGNEEGEILPAGRQVPQSGDLCGGTGGNGQIISLGKNRFTLKQKDSNSRLIHIADQATIKSSSGSASESDLKTGDRVTLVGGPNFDGSFTADTVVICNVN